MFETKITHSTPVRIWGPLMLAVLSSACVWPGSRAVEVNIRGRIVTNDGRPLANETVIVFQPASYGLTRTERRNPDAFGARERQEELTTDANGEFQASLGIVAYHVDIWKLPPLGAFPRTPPALLFAIQVPRWPEEFYAVEPRERDYTVFHADHREVPPSSAHFRVTAREEMSLSHPRSITGVVEMSYQELGAIAGDGSSVVVYQSRSMENGS